MNENIYKELKKSEEVKAYMEQGNHSLGVLGFTEHSCRHAVKVAETAGKILKKLGYGKREVELAKVAGLLHDVETVSTAATTPTAVRLWLCTFFKNINFRQGTLQ